MIQASVTGPLGRVGGNDYASRHATKSDAFCTLTIDVLDGGTLSIHFTDGESVDPVALCSSVIERVKTIRAYLRSERDRCNIAALSTTATVDPEPDTILTDAEAGYDPDVRHKVRQGE